MNLIVIRNTEAPYNVNYIVGEKSEESLTERGIMQAKELRKKFENNTVIVVTHNSICRALWMIKDEKVKTKEEINSYYHNSEDIKVYKDYKIEGEE